MSELKTLVKNFKTILFDMDGTIVNTEPLHAKAAVMVLQELNIDIDLMSMLHQFYGMTDTDVLKTLCPQMTELEIKNSIEKKNQQLIQLFKTLNPSEKEQYINKGLFEFLSFLKTEKKNIGVVSASEDIIVEETLKCFGIYDLIDIKMGRGQTEKTKPFPDPYLEAMRRFKTNSSETVIFEDSPTGLASAKKSQAFVIRITGFTHDQFQSEFKEFLHFE